jgi:NAD(P)-dependent dehydrogenase (short-subunit alcohol dehydrogenase family)
LTERVLNGRIAVVTGASRGIGAAAAVALAGAGAHVVLIARTVGGLEATDDKVKAAGGTATLVPLDLMEHDKIDALAGSLFGRFGRTDIVIGNAGMLGALTPVAHLDPKMWDKIVSLNLTANARLIRAFDPLLRASDAGRAVFVTAGVARKPEAYWGPYAASKAALEAMVRCWAAELERTPLRVNLLDPGAVATGLREQAFPGEPSGHAIDPAKIAPIFIDLASPACRRHGQVVSAF